MRIYKTDLEKLELEQMKTLKAWAEELAKRNNVRPGDILMEYMKRGLN